MRFSEEVGWYLIRTRSSHRRFRHQIESGAVTVAGELGLEVPPGTLNSVLKQAVSKTNLEELMQSPVIIKKGAHVPDLPSCVAVGETKAEAHRLIAEAIQFHIEGLREDVAVVPPPSSTVAFIDVATS